MNHVGTIEIETERLLLRPVTLEDAEAMHRNWTGDDEVTRYLTWPTHASVEVTEGFENIFWNPIGIRKITAGASS